MQKRCRRPAQAVERERVVFRRPLLDAESARSTGIKTSAVPLGGPDGRLLRHPNRNRVDGREILRRLEAAFRGLKAQARKTVQAISTGLRNLATLILRIAKILSKRLKLGASNPFVN